MSDCADCDGEGFKFTHRDGDVFMEACPSCANVTDHGPGFRGFWLDLSWSPNATSRPDAKAWKVRVIEETNGNVRLVALTQSQLHDLCRSGKIGLHWLAVITVASELARLQHEVEALRKQAEGPWSRLARFFRRLFGRSSS